MASTFGIRILEKADNILKFKVYLITSDFNFLPRTHGFGYLMLISNPELKNAELLSAFNQDDLVTNTYENGRKFVKKFELSDFENYPIKGEFRNEHVHALDTATGQFNNQDILPQATVTMQVADKKHLSHLSVGNVWECPHGDIWFGSWYLEHKSEKTHKFYHVYQNENAQWMTHYGKVGTKGRLEQTYLAGWEVVENMIVPEKLRKSKGYELIYKNFDTDWNLEDKIKAFDEDTVKELVEAMNSADVAKTEKLLSNVEDINTLTTEYGYPLLEAYVTRYDEIANNDILQLLFDAGADPNRNQFRSYVADVIENCDREGLDLFINFGLDLKNEDSATLFMAAIKKGDIEFMKKLIADGHDIKAHPTDTYYSTDANILQVLGWCKNNHVEVIDFLASKGLDMNTSGTKRIVPLHEVAKFSTKEAVERMLHHGADPLATDDVNENALFAAALCGPPENFEAIAKVCPKPALEYAFGDVLQRVEIYPEESVAKIKTLMELGITFAYMYKEGRNPNMEISIAYYRKSSIKKKQEKAIIQLLDWGLDPHKRFGSERNLLFFAARMKSAALLQKGLEMGVDRTISTMNKKGDIFRIEEYVVECKATKLLPLLE